MNSTRKNILFTSSWFPSKSHATLGNFVQRHAEAVALKNNVHVLYITFSKHQKERFLIENYEELGVKITIVYCRPAGFLNPLRKRKGFILGLQHLIEKQNFSFDLVHHNVIWKDGWQPWLINRRLKKPYIITEHWTGFDKNARKNVPLLLKPLAKLFASKASAICPVTENLAQNMKAIGIEGNYRVVPNVVDTELFQLTQKPIDQVRFLHVSSLVDAQKNISGILRSWKKAIDQNPNMHLTIGGDGPWLPYASLLEELSIPQQSISFFGEKKWSEIAELMQDSHCLLMFSNYENLPCVIVEGLASGMFILSTNVGGIAEHIQSERGTLILPNDENGLTEAILQYAGEFSNTKTAALRTYAQEHFSRPMIADAFDAVYEEILG